MCAVVQGRLDRLEEAAHWLRSGGLKVDRVYLRYTVCDEATGICWQEVAYVADGEARTALAVAPRHNHRIPVLFEDRHLFSVSESMAEFFLPRFQLRAEFDRELGHNVVPLAPGQVAPHRF